MSRLIDKLYGNENAETTIVSSFKSNNILIEKSEQVDAHQVLERLNDNFNKGLVSEQSYEDACLELDQLVKAAGHKYIRREGTKGNYRYVYKEEKGKGSKKAPWQEYWKEMPKRFQIEPDSSRGEIIFSSTDKAIEYKAQQEFKTKKKYWHTYTIMEGLGKNIGKFMVLPDSMRVYNFRMKGEWTEMSKKSNNLMEQAHKRHLELIAAKQKIDPSNLSKKELYAHVNEKYGTNFKPGSIEEFEDDEFRTQLTEEDIQSIVEDEKKNEGEKLADKQYLVGRTKDGKYIVKKPYGKVEYTREQMEELYDYNKEWQGGKKESKVPEHIQGAVKILKKVIKDHEKFDPDTAYDLKQFISAYEKGDKKAAYALSNHFDTYQRELIPPIIMKDIGGILTPKGEKLAKQTIYPSNLSKKELYAAVNKKYGTNFKVGDIEEFEDDDFRTQLTEEDIKNIIEDEKENQKDDLVNNLSERGKKMYDYLLKVRRKLYVDKNTNSIVMIQSNDDGTYSLFDMEGKLLDKKHQIKEIKSRLEVYNKKEDYSKIHRDMNKNKLKVGQEYGIYKSKNKIKIEELKDTGHVIYSKVEKLGVPPYSKREKFQVTAEQWDKKYRNNVYKI